MDKKPHADQKYIVALLNNDSQILSELYKKFTPKIVNHIRKNSGDYDDAQDVIQETLIAIY
ncbi:MAG: sigma-70 family RNA polymerase sigma factor, partial [Methanosarcinales archaeon]|nr:sigma-70 family RNA polymerase sigma factor [Methanosarcinales archaeon]